MGQGRGEEGGGRGRVELREMCESAWMVIFLGVRFFFFFSFVELGWRCGFVSFVGRLVRSLLFLMGLRECRLEVVA